MSREYPSPLRALKDKHDLQYLLKNQFKHCTHKYITTFDDLRQQVFHEMLNYEKFEGTKWSRFESLNEYMKGFRRGELTIFFRSNRKWKNNVYVRIFFGSLYARN